MTPDYNPNNEAWNRQLADDSYRAHERFTQRHGPEVSPHRPMRPLNGKLVLSHSVGNDFFYKIAPLDAEEGRKGGES